MTQSNNLNPVDVDRELVDALGKEHGIPKLADAWLKAVEFDEAQTIATFDEDGRVKERLKVGGSTLLTADGDRRHTILRFEYERLTPKTDVAPLLWLSFNATAHIDPGSGAVTKIGEFEVCSYNILRDATENRMILPESRLEFVQSIVGALKARVEARNESVVMLASDVPLNMQP